MWPASDLRFVACAKSWNQLPPAVDAILRTPRVLVLFRAAQEIESPRAFACRLLDRMRHDQRPGAQRLQIRIVAAEVVVHRVAARESVKDGDDTFSGAKAIHP